MINDCVENFANNHDGGRLILDLENAYFTKPTQVLFADEYDESCEIICCGEKTICPEKLNWIGGIAYEDYIICGECGSIVNIEDCIGIAVYSDWIDISGSICG